LATSTFGCSPPTPVVALLLAPKLIIEVGLAARHAPVEHATTVLVTNWMMLAPPGEPVPITNSPLLPSAALANTSVDGPSSCAGACSGRPDGDRSGGIRTA